MMHGEIDDLLEGKLQHAEDLATAAVRTIRLAIPHMPSGQIVRVLDDVERLFVGIDSTEEMIRLARLATGPAQAIALAELACTRARSVLDDASARMAAAGAATGAPPCTSSEGAGGERANEVEENVSSSPASSTPSGSTSSSPTS